MTTTTSKMSDAELKNLARSISGMESAAAAIVWAERTGHVATLVSGATDLVSAVAYLTRFPVDSHGFGTAVNFAIDFATAEEARSFLRPSATAAAVESAVYRRHGSYWVSMHAAAQPVAWSDSPSHPAESLEYGR